MADGQFANQQYVHLKIFGDDGGTEMPNACNNLAKALQMRDKYHTTRDDGEVPFDSGDTEYRMVNGIVMFRGQKSPPTPYSTYWEDVKELSKIIENGPCRSTCRARLKILDWKFHMYKILNSHLEERASSLHCGGGIYTTYKVDNSVRLSTAVEARELVSFIIDKTENEKDVVVSKGENGEAITMGQFLSQRFLDNPKNLSVESLGLQPDANEHFHRFDIFSKKFSRGGDTSVDLLHFFLKRTHLGGRYYGELCSKVFSRDMRKRPYVATEYKVPIMGIAMAEWDGLAQWIKDHKLGSERNRWVIQIPRIGEIRGIYKCKDQQEQLDNIFLPLWEASRSPQDKPVLAEFLADVVGFNVISDEAVRGPELPKNRVPSQWPWKENPPDVYFNYYVWANMYSLNRYREQKGLGTFTYRPTCEMGDPSQLVSGYLLANSINHALRMVSNPVLHYLYYMKQIGIVSSPLGNNGLSFTRYADNPFPMYLKQGLRVSLSTDDPLHFHYTSEPVIEEYGTAAKLLKPSVADLCETARNSVLISGFPNDVKEKWLGKAYAEGPDGNSFAHSHVPTIRLMFRDEVLKKEHAILNTARRKLKGEGAKNEGAKKEAKLLEAGRRESERAREVAREKRALRRARECGDLGDTCVLAALPSRRRETVATTIAEVCETRGHGVSKTEVGLCPNPFPTPFPITSEGGGRKGKRVIKSHPDVAQRHGPDLKPNLNDMTNLWRRLTARC